MTVFDYYMTVGTDITAEVAANLKRFVEDEVLPGTGIDAAAFWRGPA